MALRLAVLFSGFLPWLKCAIDGASLRGDVAGVAFWMGALWAIGIAGLPIDWVETFDLETRFGFNRTRPRTFVLDVVKAWVIAALLGAPLLYAVLWCVGAAGRFWWAWAWALVVVFQVLMLVVYPLWIAPLFNRFTPLAPGPLRDRLLDVAARGGIAARGVFVMDGSRRSTHSDAYFTGLGRARRIVLYDTLVGQLDGEELVAVLAHETAHWKKGHVPAIVALSAGMTFAGFFVAGRILDWAPFAGAFGFGEPWTPASLFLLIQTFDVFLFWLAPLLNALLRRFEFGADAYAARLTGAPDRLASALVKLAGTNLSNLWPHPVHSAYHHSHPTLVERIARLEGAAAGAWGAGRR